MNKILSLRPQIKRLIWVTTNNGFTTVRINA